MPALACLASHEFRHYTGRPPGLNESNYTSLRVIRGVDDRDGLPKYELVSLESDKSSSRALSFPLYGTEDTPALIGVVSMLL